MTDVLQFLETKCYNTKIFGKSLLIGNAYQQCMRGKRCIVNDKLTSFKHKTTTVSKHPNNLHSFQLIHLVKLLINDANFAGKIITRDRII